MGFCGVLIRFIPLKGNVMVVSVDGGGDGRVIFGFVHFHGLVVIILAFLGLEVVVVIR